jgi:hypothetical protein
MTTLIAFHEVEDGFDPRAREVVQDGSMHGFCVSDVRKMSRRACASHVIPSGLLQVLERLFACDLSDVRIVESDAPDRIGARAFACGSQIHVRRIADVVASPEGWWLLGHELAHVVQQRSGRVCAPSHPAEIVVLQDPALEREANRMGDAAVRALAYGEFDGPRSAPGTGATRVASRPVIQCVMALDEFQKSTATPGIRSLSKVSAIDKELKAFLEANTRKPKSYTNLSAAAMKLYQAAKAFKSSNPDSARMPGIDTLIKEIVIEHAILSKLADFEKATDELEKFKIIEEVQENFFKQRGRSELNNKTLEGEIYTLLSKLVSTASKGAEAFVLRDIEELKKIGNDGATPALLRSVIAECTSARNTQGMDAANGKPGLKYNTTRGATQKYSLSHAMEQSLGKRFRMGSLLHELTHLSIAEIFDNTCVMLAISKSATDAEILALAKARAGKIQGLLAKIDQDLPEFDRMTAMTLEQEGVKRNRLYIEFKEKALYPVSGKFANQYLRVFKAKMDPTEHARLVTLAGQGLDCELIEYDTVINQMLLWSHLYGMDPGCGTYTALEEMVREAHAYRTRARVRKSPPPRKPLPPLPNQPLAAHAKKPLPVPPTR